MSTDRSYNYEISRNIAHAVIVANWRLAEATRDSTDALAHDLAVEMWRSYLDYDQSREYLGWASAVARRRLIDRARRASRHYHRLAVEYVGGKRASEGAGEGQGAVVRYVGEVPIDEHSGSRKFVFFGSSGAEMENKLEAVPARLNRYHAGRLGHSPKAYAGAIAYRVGRSMSWSALQAALASSSSLLREFGFKTAPCRRSLIDSRRRLWAWAKRTA